MQQGDGVQVENGLCTGMVAHLGVVAGQAQDVLQTHGSSAQQVGLQSNAVTVTAGSLVDGGQASVLQSYTGSQGGSTHDGRLVVGDVNSGDVAQVSLGFLNQVTQVDALGRANFCGNDKLTVIK